MKVTRLKINGYRNIEQAEIYPDEKVNIIYGENAQGKTNLLESIWLFTGCKSFRGTQDRDLVCFGTDYARNYLDFYAGRRDQEAVITITDRRAAILNGVKLRSPASLMGEFHAVVFSPSQLALIKGGPADRRRFIDTALCRLKPAYARALAEYTKILNQRNSLLKDIPYHGELLETLDIWDERMVRAAEYIVAERVKYAEDLRDVAGEIYAGISGEKEVLETEYKIKYPEGYKSEDGYDIIFKKSRKEDLFTGVTTYGPHRDDIEVKIDGISARSFGSQGQQRSAALAMKLGEAEIIKVYSGEKPVALLDDVMSELDVGRQDYILNHLESWQVFITCCDPAAVLRLCGGKTIQVSGGRVKQ